LIHAPALTFLYAIILGKGSQGGTGGVKKKRCLEILKNLILMKSALGTRFVTIILGQRPDWGVPTCQVWLLTPKKAMVERPERDLINIALLGR
jgi:hypothetical protein